MTEKGLELIKEFEGFRADAYWDATGKVWTIGYGATFYMDGTPVKKGDRITKEEATKLLDRMVSEKFEKYVEQYVTSEINPYQKDALTSFAYNCGAGNLKRSTLLKKVNTNPSDPTIRGEFAKWNKSGGKVLNGLTRRRKAEADLYFTEYRTSETSDEDEKKNPEEFVIVETDGYGQSEDNSVSVDTSETQPYTENNPKVGFLKRIINWLRNIFSSNR